MYRVSYGKWPLWANPEIQSGSEDWLLLSGEPTLIGHPSITAVRRKQSLRQTGSQLETRCGQKPYFRESLSNRICNLSRCRYRMFG